MTTPNDKKKQKFHLELNPSSNDHKVHGLVKFSLKKIKNHKNHERLTTKRTKSSTPPINYGDFITADDFT